MLPDAFCQYLAPLGKQQLGIPQSANAIPRIENHCSRYHRAEEGTTTHFIDSGHEARTCAPGLFFKTYCAAQSFQQAQFGSRRGEFLVGRLGISRHGSESKRMFAEVAVEAQA